MDLDKVFKYFLIFLVTVTSTFIAGCSGNIPEPVKDVTTAVPAEFKAGEELFNDNCARCHGLEAAGTSNGPTFLNEIYRPNMHSDEGFVLAAKNGVRPHHWNFGAMPPQPQVSRDEVLKIVEYVRWLQEQAGILNER